MTEDNLKRTKEAVENWFSQPMKEMRVELYRQLARKAGLETELGMIPRIHIELMDYDRWAMNVVALAKVRHLFDLAAAHPVG